MQCEYFPMDNDTQCGNEAEVCLVWAPEPNDDDLGGMRLALLMCGDCAMNHHQSQSWQLEFELW